jgi:hypothetical protein
MCASQEMILQKCEELKERSILRSKPVFDAEASAKKKI